MKRAIVLFAALYGTWLLLSGHYTATLMIYGALSCAAVVAISAHLGNLDDEAVPIHLGDGDGAVGGGGDEPPLMQNHRHDIIAVHSAQARLVARAGHPARGEGGRLCLHLPPEREPPAAAGSDARWRGGR